MKKIIKCFLLIIIAFFLSSCSIDYNVNMYSSKNIIEHISFKVTYDSSKKTESEMKNELNEEVELMKKNPYFNGYEIKSNHKKNYSSIELTKKYISLNEFKNSIIFKSIFENITLIQNNQYVLFQTTGDYYHGNIFGASSEIPFDPQNTEIKEVVMKFRFANQIIETNADIKDNKKNNHTWLLKPEEMSKSIYFKFSHKKRLGVLIDMLIKENIIVFVLLTFTALFAIVLIIYIFMKSKLENRL